MGRGAVSFISTLGTGRGGKAVAKKEQDGIIRVVCQLSVVRSLTVVAIIFLFGVSPYLISSWHNRDKV
jgi:hypothetical protein